MLIRSVADLIDGRPLHVISPEAPVLSACHAMRDHEVGVLAVCEQARLVGLLSERDVIRRAAVAPLGFQRILVGEIMTREPRTIEIVASVGEALIELLDGGIRHLPVEEDGRPVGIISLRDIPAEGWKALFAWRQQQSGRSAAEQRLAIMEHRF